MSSRFSSGFLLLVVVVLVALNTRPGLASLGPVLDLVQARANIGPAAAGLLTTLPVVIMGLAALLGSRIHALLGIKKGIGAALLLVIMGTLLRYFLIDALAMFVSAAVAGLGIAIIQTLVPAVIGRHLAAVKDRAMGFYTTGIMAGAAIAAATTAWLEQHAGLNVALGIWALLGVAALIAWLPLSFDDGEVARPQGALSVVIKRPITWCLLVYFGLGTSAYTLALAWLPPYYIELGNSRAFSGSMLALLTLTEVLCGLLIGAFIHHFPDRRAPLYLVLLCLVAGLGLAVIAPQQCYLLTVILLGIGIGSLFPLSLLTAMDYVRAPSETVALMSVVQGGGYILASLMPFIAGQIQGYFDELRNVWFIMGVLTLVMMAMTHFFKPLAPSGKSIT